MQKNENRLGYKKTKVGWIPKDWACVPLGDVFSQCTTRGEPGLPVFSVTQDRGLVRRDEVDRRVLSSLTSEECLLVEPGDFAYNTMRMWQGAVDLCIERGVVSPAYVVCRPRITEVFPLFMLRYFKSPIGLYKLWSYSYGLTDDRLRLYFKDFCHVPAPLPPLPEQEAIAGVLECWDRGIEKLHSKIVKKRTVKTELMQALLSGRIRLPGFGTTEDTEEHGKGRNGIPAGWKEVRFDEIFSFLKTYALSRAQLTTDSVNGCGIYNIHYGDLHATYDGCMLDCDKEKRIPLLRDSTELPPKAIFLKEGDVVIADVSEDYEGIGSCVELRNVGSKKITGGLHTFVIRDAANETAEGYRGYILKEVAVSRELKRIATGVSVHGVSKTNLAKAKIVLPCLEEQQSIAVVLSKAEAELAALDRKLVVLKEQKRFLLNNLVTGTIRLPEFCDHGKHGITRK